MEKQIIPIQIENLSFDSFARNPQTDVVCVAPVRTIVRREEEIVLIRKVRKLEEFDAGVACPVTADQATVTNPGTYTPPSAVEPLSGELPVYADVEDEGNLANFINTWGKPITVTFEADGTWNYGREEYQLPVDGNGRLNGPIHNARFKEFHGSTVPPAALVALKNGLYNPEVVGFGKKQTVTLQPGEKVLFMINDEPGYYRDNSGNLTVRWSFNNN